MDIGEEDIGNAKKVEDLLGETNLSYATTPGWARFEYAAVQKQWDRFTETFEVRKSPSEVTTADLVGKSFTSIEEASAFYEMYAAILGFGIRKSFLRYNVRGEPSNRSWVCCKEGVRSEKYFDLPRRSRTPRALTREKCMASFQVTLCRRSRKWKVKSFVVEHSHPLSAGPLTQFLRDKRVVCDGAKRLICNLKRSGIQTTKIMSYFAQSVGGYDNVRFITKDVYNKLGRELQVTLAEGDAERAIGYLQGKADTDSAFYGRYTHDCDNRLRNLFWSDGKARSDYRKYGDVLTFDSTYKTNQYGKPLLVFVGVNNHYRTTIFGYALLFDESNETYVWALSTFIKCMDGCAPKSVITDGDLAMRFAITEVMPKSVHRLCAWHIEKNVVSNVKEVGFLPVMGEFIKKKFEPDEFTRKWDASLIEFGLENNEYLRHMYMKRELWAETYLTNTFFAGQCTTQRSEKMNAFLKTKVTKKMNLCEFFRAIDMANSWLRHKQVEDDYKQFWTKPVATLSNMLAIEEEAAKLYTPTMFHKVQAELQREGKYIVQSVENCEGRLRAVLAKYPDSGNFRNVDYEPMNDRYSCECGLMSTTGIPCRHIFSTMKALQKKTMPKSLINDRWTRDDERGDRNKFNVHADRTNKFTESELRFGHVTSKCSEVAALASVSSEAYDVAMKSINQLLVELLAMREEGKKCEGAEQSSQPTSKPVLNPTYGTTKGGWRGSKKGGKGKKRCSKCQRTGHNKATCKIRVKTVSTATSSTEYKWTAEDLDSTGGCEMDSVEEENESNEEASSGSKRGRRVREEWGCGTSTTMENWWS